MPPSPPLVVSTTPPHLEASPDRPGAVAVSRIVARNSHHPEPYTGTRTVLVRSSRPRGSAAAAGGVPPRTPLRWRGPQGTRNAPNNFGSAAGGFTQALGGRAGPKLERVEFPAGWQNLAQKPPPAPDGTPSNPKRPRQFWVGGWGLYSGARGAGGVQTRKRRISRGLGDAR